MGSSTFHVDICCFTVILEHGVYTASWLSDRVCVCERGLTSHALATTTADQGQGLCRTPLCSPSTKTQGAPEMALTPVGPVPTTHLWVLC